MRWTVFIILQCLVLAIIAGIFYVHRDTVIALKKPPQSLAQWYKPQNKRQVWLHTMFKLRREMLAVEIYAQAQDSENLKKWGGKLAGNYKKIGKMVPEWNKRLNHYALAKFENNILENRFEKVLADLQTLAKNCQSCHVDFRAITATLYRAPDFSNMKIDGKTPLTSHMKELSQIVNKIKIAFVDDKKNDALSALTRLKEGMEKLGATCKTCHKKNAPPYPNDKMRGALDQLQKSLKTGTLQDKGKALGGLAVMACAKCHGVHRILSDTKNLLSNNKSWGALFKNSH